MTKRTIKTCSVKTLAIFLSVLMIFYLIPATAYASLFEASDAESVVSEATEYTGEVFEDVSRREENVKHFRLEDGTYMAAQYDTAVHTLDETGEWQDIDNTLFESGSEYSTSNARIKFAKKITGNESIFTLHENNRKVTLSLDGAIKKTAGVATNTETEFDETATTLQKMMTLDKLSSRIIYEDILDGVDLEYIVVSNNVKENIIVKEQKDAYSYSFTLKLNNLSATLSATGDVEISDPDSGEVLYIIPAPVVYDANMTYASETDAYYTLETIGQTEYRLTVTANASWMNASDRAFPVTIDPAIYYGGYGMQQMCDTCVSENYPTGVYGSRTYLKVGYDSANANLKAYVAMRSLPTLPAGSMITKAELNLTYNGTAEGISTANPLTLVAKKIIRSGYTSLWTESSTNYNTAMTYGDILDYRIISSASGDNVESWNITTAVVDWYADSTTNQGIAIMQYDMTDTTVHTVQFHSSDSSDLDDYYTPFFTIAYVSTIGIESYYSYQSTSAGLAGTGYVNNATGALSFVKSLLSTTDSLLPYTVSMTYNSDFAGKAYQYSNAQTAYSTSYMPYGFKLNINETIIEKKYTNDTSGQSLYYIWSDADGTEHAFFPVYDTNKKEYVYVNEDGLQLTLNVTSSVCTITDDSKTVKTFTAMSSTPASDVYNAWYLTSISDKNGNTVSFSFDSSLRPTGVNLTPNGSSTISFLTLVYNDDGHLSMIRNDTSNEAIVFRYSNTYGGSIVTSGTNYLRQIVYAHGNASVTTTNWTNFYTSSANTTNITVDATATYTYDSAGQLTKVVDTLSGYRIDYTYSSGKVTVIQEYGSKDSSTFTAGQKIGLTYSNGYTEARISGTDDVYGNTDDIITRYVFDESGRAVGIYSTDSTRTIVYGASAGEYQKAEKVKNNLKTSTAIGGSATNYLLNGGFETISSGIASYWTRSSTNVSYETISNTEIEPYRAKFTVKSGVTDYITQYTKLPAGTYTLSMSVSTINCTDTQAFVEVKSLNTGTTLTEEIPMNENYATGIPSSFSMTFDNTTDSAIYKITISVIGGSFNDTTVREVSVDNVMLEENIGNSAYSLVQMGNFDAFAVNSAGTATATVGTYWQTPSGNATAYASGNSLFGKVGKVDGNINSENYIKQRVYTASSSILNSFNDGTAYPDQATTFTLSAFALGTAQVPNANSKFRIRVNVYYYEGTGNANTVETKDFYFVNDYRDWQFVCGSFTTLPGKCVHYIDVICEYSYQPGGYALFDNIAVTESSDGSVIEYEYYDSSNAALEGLLRMQKSGYDAEYYEYNSNRMVTRIANNRGEIVDYTYAANGVDVANEIYYTFTYGNNNSKIYPYLIANPDSAITKTPKTKTEYSYNSYGQLTSTRTMALNANLIRDTSEKYITTFTSYLTSTGSKLFGAVLSSTDNLDRVTRYIYNTTSTYNYGDLMAVVNVSEGTGTCYTYDAIGNMLTVTPCTYTEATDTYSAVNGEENVQYVYGTTADPRNLLHSVTTGSTTYTFTYDNFGNSNTISAGSRNLASYSYNSNNGKLNTITYGNGFYVEYVYDELDNVKEVWYNGTKVYEYTYTAYGQVYRFDNLIDGTSTIYEYDPTGKLVHFTEFDSSDMVNEFSSLIYYDEEGKLKDYFFIGAYSNTSGVNDWSTYYYNDYLPDGRLDSFSLAADGDITAKTANATVNFTYDKYNRLTNKAYTYTASSSFTASASYTFTETTAATSSQVATYTSTVGTSSVTSTYTYDDNGYITKIVLSTGAEYRYVYDDLGQLKREDNTVTGKTYIYEYDDAGNITSKNTYSIAAAGVTPTSLLSSVTYGYNDEYEWGDLLTSYGNVTITYDEIGNPLSYYNGSSYTFTWKNGRQLATASVNSNTLSFNYNDEGIRTSKTVNGVVHTYRLSGSDIIAEEWGNNLIVYLYDADGSPMGMQYRTSTMAKGLFYTFWFEKNLQGDIVAVYNSAGTKVVSYTYDAWGNCTTTNHNISSTNSYATYNPFRYRGYYRDSELGFYYLNSRYYDPAVGRFINADVLVSTGQGLLGYNMFVYCNNNPIAFSDPSGEVLISAIIIGVVIGAAAAFGGTVVADYKDDGEVFNGSVSTEQYIAATVIGGTIGGLTGGIASSTFSVTFPTITYAVTPAGTQALTVGASTVAVSGTAVLTGAGLLAIPIAFSRIGKSNGYIIDHHYPNDHDPTHVHVKGDDIGETRIDMNGNPLNGDPPLSSQGRKAFKRLYKAILKELQNYLH